MSTASGAKRMKPAREEEHQRLDVQRIKVDFPILSRQVNGHQLVYLDNAATTQKPRLVIDAIGEYYRKHNANIYRGLHTLSEEATEKFEKTRAHAARFIGGAAVEEVVFTRGATEALNLIAYTWGEQNIKAGDEIVLTEMEHHANLVPWIMLAKKKNATVKIIPITNDGYLDISTLDTIITSRTKLVAVTHVSNVLGTINPVNEIVRKAHDHGAVAVVDGAQAVPHMPVNVKNIDADFYVLSAHKMLGPTGVGILYGKREILEDMPPFNMGGEMIREVTFANVTWNDLPLKFEAGTPDIAGVIAFDAALTYLDHLGMDAVRDHERQLTDYALTRLGALKGLTIHGPKKAADRGGVISFADEHIHPHDISTFLDSKGIAIRAGHHCAQPLVKLLGYVATARASLYIYNDEDDIDALYDALVEMRRFFKT
jgi:cysteine desulfurase/selenocysteine lyase